MQILLVENCVQNLLSALKSIGANRKKMRLLKLKKPSSCRLLTILVTNTFYGDVARKALGETEESASSDVQFGCSSFDSRWRVGAQGHTAGHMCGVFGWNQWRTLYLIVSPSVQRMLWISDRHKHAVFLWVIRIVLHCNPWISDCFFCTSESCWKVMLWGQLWVWTELYAAALHTRQAQHLNSSNTSLHLVHVFSPSEKKNMKMACVLKSSKHFKSSNYYWDEMSPQITTYNFN